MTCSHCFFPFDNIKSTTNETESPPDGALLLCGKCGYVNVVCVDEKTNLSSTRLITKEEYNNLHPADKNDLYFAVRAIIAKHKQNKSNLILPSWYQNNEPK